MKKSDLVKDLQILISDAFGEYFAPQDVVKIINFLEQKGMKPPESLISDGQSPKFWANEWELE